MNWLNRAEARFGYLGIPGLSYLVVGFTVLVYVLYKLSPQFLGYLDLDMNAVMQGQVWRLVTFLFIPRWGGLFPEPIGFVFYILYIFYIGTGLERAMGAFRFTVYYVVGMIGLVIAACITNGYSSNMVLNTSLLLAFARFFPEAVIYVMFILPMKVKWLAWLSAAWLVYLFLTGDNGVRLATVAAFLNYLLFFGRDLVHDARHRQKVSDRRARFERDVREGTSATLHECVVCHRTESTPDLEFRIARDGEEYCLEHLPKPAPTG